METMRFVDIGYVLKFSSYRTYEEWKHFFFKDLCPTFPCSYRTYEEWKLSMWDVREYSIRLGSYRTYEEWKHSVPCICRNTKVPFLPYLWGMETWYGEYGSESRIYRSYRTYEEWKLVK